MNSGLVQSRCGTPHQRPVQASVTLTSMAEVIARKRDPAILGGNPSAADPSIFCAEPIDRFSFLPEQTDPFSKLQRALAACQTAESEPVFHGGWIGYFGYELGRFIERLPARAPDDIGLPLIRLAFYDKAIVYDPAKKTWFLTVLEIEGEQTTADEKFKILEDWLSEAKQTEVPPPPESSAEPVRPENAASAMSRKDYFNALRKIHRYILDGEVYQINFSRRLEKEFAGRPIDLFHWQNTHNPSPYAAYLAGENWAIVSASPELFLRIQGDRIVTRPIKGTRPRASGPNARAINRANRADLINSEKEKAELAMIVDLERNDLARICLPGTRRVSRQRDIEQFPTVYHAVATIEGTLPRRNDPHLFCEILKAVFPGGSITGAPKIRAMEIIDELEPAARSVYTGSIGRIGPDGNVRLNIAIRTIILKNRRAYLQTGGGIVADSDPQDEWNETLLKAGALLEGIAAVNHHTGRAEYRRRQ